MKRKVPLLAALVLMLSLSLVLTPVAKAAPGGIDVPSTERGGDDLYTEIGDLDTPLADIGDTDTTLTTIDDLEVPLFGLSLADIIIEAYHQTGISVETDQMFDAVETVRGGAQARIEMSTEGDGPATTSVSIPTAALKAVVEEGYPSVAIFTDMAQLLMPNEVVASIVAQAEKAGGETVVFTMTKESAEQGQSLVGADVDVERIENGSVVTLSIQSGSAKITSFGGAAATLSLAADDNFFEIGLDYTVIANRAEYVGRANLTETGVGVEIPISSPGTFVLLADAVEKGAVGNGVSVVASPLAARIGGGEADAGGSGMQINPAYICFAAAALLSAVTVAVVAAAKRRQKS